MEAGSLPPISHATLQPRFRHSVQQFIKEGGEAGQRGIGPPTVCATPHETAEGRQCLQEDPGHLFCPKWMAGEYTAPARDRPVDSGRVGRE